MTVNRIEEVSSSKVKVYIDEEFAFALYKGELRKYGIKEEKELTEAAYREITGEVLPKRAKLRCMNLLQKKDYTRKQLADKLKKSQLAKTQEDFENLCRPYGCQKVVLTSGENGYGIPELQAVLNEAVAAEFTDDEEAE